jgi:hypothetical protein
MCCFFVETGRTTTNQAFKFTDETHADSGPLGALVGRALVLIRAITYLTKPRDGRGFIAVTLDGKFQL